MNDIESRTLEYLLNSLWQVPLVFAAAWIAARIARRSGPRMEHRVWVSALMLEAALPACRFRLDGLLREVWDLALRGSGTAGGRVQVVVNVGAISGAGMLRMPKEVFTGIAVAYGCSLLYFAGRLASGLWRTRLMERQADPVTLMGETKQRWERYGRIFGCEAATLAVSPMIAGPVTVGGRQGVMLVPPGFLENITEEDLDAVAAHEFAHMRRRDFLKNLAYGVLSLPAAYHPLLWLTRSRVAESREMVCDAMAAEAVAGKERYARSLLRLASLLVKGTPDKTLHAIGIFDANIFERRVMKLTQRPMEIRGARQFAMAAACVMVGLATCASALTLRMDVAASAAAPVSQSESSARMTVPPKDMVAVYRKNPVYPAEARANKDTLDGPVVLAVTVSEDGMPTEVHVTKSLRPDYDESALVAVREWRWHPYLLNGNPVAVDTTVTVNYSLGR
jgi:TonB family protein